MPSNEITVPVPFPRLTASVASAHVKLSWSNAASAMTIRSSTNLNPPIAWLPVTNIPIFQNGLWQIQWSPDDAVRFFRLATE